MNLKFYTTAIFSFMLCLITNLCGMEGKKLTPEEIEFLEFLENLKQEKKSVNTAQPIYTQEEKDFLDFLKETKESSARNTLNEASKIVLQNQQHPKFKKSEL